MNRMMTRATRVGIALIAAIASYLGAAGPAQADATDDYPIPHRIIITTCDTEQYLSPRCVTPARFTSSGYMIDKSNRPADVQQGAVDRFIGSSRSIRSPAASTRKTRRPTCTTSRWQLVG